MPFMYPEQLRELRAQYPNTQFDGHGRVIGGTPLNQYNAQPANPAAIPASVRTYSQFDPATNTWIRHTNGAVSPVQGMTPTSTPGVYLRPRQQAQPARQVMRPLPRGNGQPVIVDTPTNLGLGVTQQNVGTYDYSKTHGNEDPRAPLTQPGLVVVNGENASATTDNTGKTPSGIEFVGGQPVSTDVTQNIPITYDGELRSLNGTPSTTGIVGQPVVNADSTEIGQAVPIREATPRLDLNGYTPPTQGEANWGRALGGAATAVAVPAITGAALMYGPALAGSALNLGRTALTGGLGAAAKVLPKNMTSRVSSWANSAIDGSKNLFNRLGGFLRRPATPEEAAAQAQQSAYQQAANIGAKVRAGQYYTH